MLFDAVYVPGGEASVAALQEQPEALEFLDEAFKHCKTIAAIGAGVELLESAGLPVAEPENDPGLIAMRDGDPGTLAADFINAIALHRHWEREMTL